MKKTMMIAILSAGSLAIAQVQNYSGKVGINTENPTQVLDVNGNVRVRDLQNANDNITDFPRTVVSKADGTLGYITQNKVLLNLEHIAAGLKFNAKDLPGGSSRDESYNGVQENMNNYMIFGSKVPAASDAPAGSTVANPGSYTYQNTIFSATEGDILDISSIINFKILKNFAAANLDNVSTGDRQVIISLYLYKGNNIVQKVIKPYTFRGPEAVFKDKFQSEVMQTINMLYIVPRGGTGNDYSITITTTMRANAMNGLFRLDYNYNSNIKQYLRVIKL